jgi:hypothetical protein
VTKARPQILNLNGAEVDREAVARADIDSYANKAQIFENALPAVKGGMFRAPGTRFLAHTAAAAGIDQPSVLRAWRYARTQAFTLEITPGKIRIVFGTAYLITGGAEASFDAGGWGDASSGGGTTSETEPDWSPPPPPLPPPPPPGGAPGSGGGEYIEWNEP